MKKLPTSGAEPLFSDLVYGTPRGVANNNCYAWALGAYRGSGGIKLQPGNMSRQSTNLNASSCPFLRDRAMDDNRKRGMYLVKPESQCRKGFYKIMAFIDKGKDYHWYKQNGSVLYRVSKGESCRSIARDLGVPVSSVVCPKSALSPGDLVYVRRAGVFSHKQGFATGPLLRDASTRVIPDPRAADRNYGAYNYRTFCGAMCIRNIGKKSASVSRPEQKQLRALLQERIRLLDAGREKAPQRLGAGPKVKGRNARHVKLKNVRARA